MLAALTVAGLPTDRFFFEGFLPVRSAARRARAAELAAVPGTLVFFESARRVAETLADLAVVLGDRDAAVARELTKKFEAVRRGSLRALAGLYAAEDAPRAESVLLVAPPAAGPPVLAEADLDARIGAELGRLSVKDAAAVVAGETGLPRRQVYARAIALASRRDAP